MRTGMRSILITLAVMAAVAGFGSSQLVQSPADAAGAPVRVTMSDGQPGDGKPGYEPAEITVKVGQAVLWHNSGKEAHTVTADDMSFDSGMKNANEDWQYTFSKPGQFAYHCTPHPWMKGTVKVAP